MGALLYACLTLIGRETDRLTHVLVNEPFETIPEFFFPDQPGGHVTNRAGEAFAPADARIELADVPFVPLRNLFIRELGQPAGSFQRLVDLCRTRVRRSLAEQLRLELETDRTIARVNDRQLKLNPREYLVFLFFATRAKNEEPAFPAYKDALDPLNEFREARIQEALADIADWRSSDALKARLDEHDLTRLRSDIKKKAIAAGGDAAHLVNVLPEKGRCSLDLPSANITITREK